MTSMDDATTLELEAGPARLSLVPEAGGRIGRLRVFDQDLLVTAHDVGATDEIGTGADPMAWGSFPMAPWAGRIRHGRFTHDGRPHQLPLDLPPHAIHGTTYRRPWSVTRVHTEPDAADVTLEIVLGSDGAGPGDGATRRGGDGATPGTGDGATPGTGGGDGWPFGGRVVQQFRLGPGGLRCRMTVHAGTTSMPAELGWHPWFVKPDHVWFEPRAMYRRDDEGIAVDRTVDPADVSGPYDDCFINDRPVVLVVGDVAVTVTSDADHWVLYDEPDHSTCVEPQSGPPDAFNLRPRVLRPGEHLERTMMWAWSTTA